MSIRWEWLFVLALVGCADSVVDDEGGSAFVEIGDERADSLDPLYLRAAGMSLWAEPRIVPDGDRFIVAARTSHDLREVTALLDGKSVDAAQRSTRKFEVYLSAEELVSNLEGAPLVVELFTRSGLLRHAMFAPRARFGPSSGSSKIYPWRAIDPVIVARETVFRGRLTTPSDFVELGGRNDDDSEPEVWREDERHWVADFPAFVLPWAASPTEDAVSFVGTTADGRTYGRDVQIVMELEKLGLTSDAPDTVWPAPTCTASVKECVQARGEDADLEACGSTAEVRPCLGAEPVDDLPVLKERFADAFRAHLIEYYAQHGADIASMGGNTRPQALVSVDTAKMTEVTDSDEVPSGHDLADHRVLTHPDVVFPGSDIIWFAIFGSDGSLLEIYDFN